MFVTLAIYGFSVFHYSIMSATTPEPTEINKTIY